ncbi:MULTISPECIES: hypothetical protein [unclassified Chamaesiphon]|uniref:hypothetical protein n=1 Tax=unclassified Chamaesiphon TaxID=2620921 RepID=UPI00286D3F34|nr:MULTISPECIES: hypothetical protein [unclassified Chamaesiphon]
MQFKKICGSMFAAIVALESTQMMPASAQLVPEPWVTVGSKNGTVSYGAGVKVFDLGAEIATSEGTTGVDVLKFFGFPIVSPYAGLGIYGDKGVAYSGGVHFTPPGNTFYGLGYHSIRGINGQVGIKF